MRHLIKFLLLTVVTSLFGLLSSQPAKAQDDTAKKDQPLGEMELIERVELLQQAFSSADVSKRDAAEKELLELGVRVLDYLDPITDESSAEFIARTSRVRRELEKIAVAEVTQASSVSLSGAMSVGQILEKIKKQTGNDIDLPEGTPDVFRNREIDIQLKDVPFWEAVAEVMEKGDLMVATYSGAPGQLRLTPTAEARIEAAAPDDAQPKSDNKSVDAPPRNVSGVFELMVKQVTASRNLANPSLNYCNIRLLVRWEPRVTPISIQLPASTLQVIDKSGNAIAVPNQDAVFSGTVQPEIPELEFSIPISLVDRQIEIIQSLDAKIDAVLPGRVETFRFKRLGKTAGAKQTKAGATVTYQGIQKNEDLFGVTIVLSFDEEHNALESHQSWVYGNPIYLQNKANEKFEAIAYEVAQQSNSAVQIRYYFERDPSEMTLFYKTPAAIVKVPVEISLKKIPLP